MGRRGYSSSFSTGGWKKPCGVNCPVKWRYIKGLEGVGIFRWGGYLNAHADNTLEGVPQTDNHVKWRLGNTCTNRECRVNKGNYFTLAHQSD
jgi:hypothetical protein